MAAASQQQRQQHSHHTERERACERDGTVEGAADAIFTNYVYISYRTPYNERCCCCIVPNEPQIRFSLFFPKCGNAMREDGCRTSEESEKSI